MMIKNNFVTNRDGTVLKMDTMEAIGFCLRHGDREFVVCNHDGTYSILTQPDVFKELNND